MDFGNLDLTVAAKRLARDVRARTDPAAHRDGGFDEHWVRFTPTGGGQHEVSVLVPLSAGVSLPLMAREGHAEGDPKRLLEEFAADIAGALPQALRATAMLTRYVAGVRRAAIREVEAARRAGLEVQLEHVSLKPTLAWHMNYPSWRDSADHVLAVVGVRCLDFALRSGVSDFVVAEADEVAGRMAERLETQAERQARRADLRARGADLEVDAVTMRILAHFDLDAADLLRRVERDQIADVQVKKDGYTGRLILVGGDGRVHSSLELEGLPRWSKGLLEIPSETLSNHPPLKQGYLLGPVAGHPIFRGLVVTGTQDVPGASITLVHVHAPTLLFDGVSGATWSEERQAA